jgi:cell wall-associated NlpC family hydrolase
VLVEPPGKRLDQPTERVLVRRLPRAVAGLVVLTLCVTAAPSAIADPDRDGHGNGFPSQEQVQKARARAAEKQRDVGAIKVRLLLANQRLERTQTRAEQATEAYNGAMWRLDQASRRLRDAQAEAASARRTVAAQRDRIGALVAASYQHGNDLTALNALMGADGPEGVLDQYAGFQGASTSLQADYQRFAASDALARVFERKAASAKAEQTRLATQARSARAAAAAAAEEAQTQAVAIAAKTQHLIRELAAAQGISVRLAEQRQEALAEIARKRAEARARAEALAAAQAQAAAEAKTKAAAKARAAAQARAEAQARAAAKRAAEHKKAQDAPQSEPPAPPAPTPPAVAPAPKRTGGRDQAISFARAQLGEPYLWGATGPSSWDCSGLTQGALAAAGVSLPHYSVAQYYAGTPIPVGDARSGDLLFWSSNGAPSGIHHVALYLGDGDFIEAPHTGADVRYNSIYSWYPDFAVRL